jgi:hypothetical protein
MSKTDTLTIKKASQEVVLVSREGIEELESLFKQSCDLHLEKDELIEEYHTAVHHFLGKKPDERNIIAKSDKFTSKTMKELSNQVKNRKNYLREMMKESYSSQIG